MSREAYILDLFDEPPKKAREYRPSLWIPCLFGIPVPGDDQLRQWKMLHADTSPTPPEESHP